MQTTKVYYQQIETKFWNGSQSIYKTNIYRANTGPTTIKIKCSIRIDSIKSQSYLKAEAWNPTELKWNFVASIPVPEMKSIEREVFAYRPVKELSAFDKGAIDQDLMDVRAIAEQILF
jgi:hypothetical protein